MVNTLEPKELNQLIVEKAPLFLFDIRSTTDFNSWKIEGENIEYLNVPFAEFRDGVQPIVGKIPADKPVVIVCNKGRTAITAAEMLGQMGLEVKVLTGGMTGWSEYLYTVKVYEDADMAVHQFIRVGKGCLSYMVISGQNALVVDPSRFVEQYVDFAKAKEVTITHIVDSHLHADHLSGGRLLAEQTGANYYLMKSEGAVFDFEALENYDKIEFANVSLEVLAVKTPGHTPGSVSFFVNNKLLFSGDTIFVTGLGRPDLGGKAREWAADLYDTIYSKVSQFADDVLVLPGHYASFREEMNDQGYIGNTLDNIRKMNDIMAGKTVEEFVDHVAASATTDTPPNYEDIIAINRGVQEAAIERKQELEIGPNRCAVHHTR